jgi:hypothetical protein
MAEKDQARLDRPREGKQARVIEICCNDSSGPLSGPGDDVRVLRPLKAKIDGMNGIVSLVAEPLC